jgi:hypothetical protein
MGLARHASRLPLTAVSWSLAAWERSAGLREFALRRGNEALQIAAHTPLGRLLPTLDLDDGADEEAARIAAAVRTEPATPPARSSRTTSAATTAAAKTAPTPKPEPEPTPEPEQAASSLTPSAVSTEVEQIVEQVVDQLAIPEPETRDELPIPDFDNITLGSLRARLRNLSVEQLVALREWEQAHAHRMPVLTALDNRIAKLGPATDAYPDGGKPSTPTRSG